MTTIAPIVLALVLFGLPVQAAPAPAKMSKVAAGKLVIDPPTLINPGFAWSIQGDKRNAKAEVSYSKQGESAWKTMSGNAPDLGTLESGQPMAHYGSRSGLCAKRDIRKFSVRKNHVQEA